MSHDEAKVKHSKRIYANTIAVNKQVKIAKAHGITVDKPHKFVKHHALDCGNPKCPVCSSPRKLTGERTIQEKRFLQGEEYHAYHGTNS